MAIKVVQEYLYALKPSVDMNAWKKATGTIESFLDKQSASFDDYLVRRKQINDKIRNLKRDIQKTRSAGGDTKELKDKLQEMEDGKSELWKSLSGKEVAWGVLNKAIKTTVGAFNFATTAMNEVTENIEKIANKSIEISNKFVSSSSMFVDTDTRSLMAKFGVSSIQAQGISSVTDVMGISTSDFGSLTSGQIELYNQLMQVYQDGINSIDTDKLENFNDSVQEYQAMQAEFQIKLQLAVTKLFAESETLPKLLDTVGDFFDSIANLLGSPIIQAGFDAFAKLLDNVVKVVNFALSPLNLGENDSKNVYNNITVNSKVDARGTGYSANELFEGEAQAWKSNYGG